MERRLPPLAQRYVDGLYQALLGRAATAGEADRWTTPLVQGTQTLPGALQGFLQSPEYEVRVVDEHYHRLLQREPEPGILPAWQAVMQASNRIATVTEAFLASPEYYALQGGTDLAWIHDLYRDVFGREADAAGQAAWLHTLDQGASREAVAEGFRHQQAVTEAYQVLLGRAPEAAGMRAWMQAEAHGLAADALVAAMVAAPEFQARLASESVSAPAPSAPQVSSWSIFAGIRPDPAPAARHPSLTPLGIDFVNGSEPPDYVPTNDPDCPCAAGGINEAVRTPAEAQGGGTANSGYTLRPIRYADGLARLVMDDLRSDAFGVHWGITRIWTSQSGYAPDPTLGSGVSTSQFPILQKITTDTGVEYVVFTGGGNARIFQVTGSTFTEHHFLRDLLTSSTTNHELTFQDPTGRLIVFADFSTFYPAAQRGKMKRLVDPGNNALTVLFNASGQITEMQRTGPNGSGTLTESWLVTYLTSGVNTGKIANLTLRRNTGSGYSSVRQAAYTYYDGTQAHGNLGDLQTITLEDGAGTTLDTQYIRYYTGEAGGNVHDLKYYFSAPSYARLVAALGSNVGSLTDTQVAPYADNYFEFDGSEHVTKEIAQGEGCSSCTGGLGTFLYSYTAGGFSGTDYNTWGTKTVETLPDGNQNIVFTNKYAEPMLQIYHDVTTGQDWRTFYQYDPTGKLLLRAEPSAVTGYDATKADLLNKVSGNYQYLADATGPLTTYDYFTTTTATGATPGGVAGYVQDVKLQQGETGTPILQRNVQYIANATASPVIYAIANDTRYRNTDGTGAETTSYSYSW